MVPAVPDSHFPDDPATLGHDLFRRWRLTQDPRLRDQLVGCHLGLAEAMARRYGSRGQDHDDLRQVGVIGLIKAIDRFDPDRGVTFATFAVPTILGEIRRHFRDRGWMIRVPRRFQDLARRAEETHRRLQQEGRGRTPSPEQVADDLGEDVDDVRVAVALMRSCYRPGELHDVAQLRLVDRADSPADIVCRDVLVEQLLDTLPRRERRIFVLRYYGGHTQQEIADQVGISQMHVSRLLRAGLADLRAAMDDDLPDAA